MVRSAGGRWASFPAPPGIATLCIFSFTVSQVCCMRVTTAEMTTNFLLRCGNLPWLPRWTLMQTAPRLIALLFFALLTPGSSARADDDGAALRASAPGLPCGHGHRRCRPRRPGRRRFRGPAALSALPLPAGGATEPATGAAATCRGAARRRPAAPARRRDCRVSRATGGSARNADTAVRVAEPTSPRDRPGRRTLGNTAWTATRRPRCAAIGSPGGSPWARPMD